jgi:hypothetical protein
LIRRIAEALEADLDELLLMAKKIPERIRQRVFERPDAFRRLAALDDVDLDAVMTRLARKRQYRLQGNTSRREARCSGSAPPTGMVRLRRSSIRASRQVVRLEQRGCAAGFSEIWRALVRPSPRETRDLSTPFGVFLRLGR